MVLAEAWPLDLAQCSRFQSKDWRPQVAAVPYPLNIEPRLDSNKTRHTPYVVGIQQHQNIKTSKHTTLPSFT